jgi:putative hydrolase of the HAD superfamily
MSPLRAVVFDLDDTLYPERDYVRGGFSAVADHAASTMGEDSAQVLGELWEMFQSGVRRDTIDQWLRGRGRDPAIDGPGMIEAYRAHAPRLTPYPDVAPALEGLRGAAKLGLITEGRRAGQQAKLDALGLRPRLEKVVILGEDERADWKPSRVPFDRWLEGSGLAPEQAVYLADNPAKDFLGARRAGWRSIRVRRADGLHRDEEPIADDARPDEEIQDLVSLGSILTRAGVISR